MSLVEPDIGCISPALSVFQPLTIGVPYKKSPANLTTRPFIGSSFARFLFK